ncbi:MAG: DNA ligase D [Aromatoleum sp.]|jgi:bifunctional non-homologous end joining protein LigD|uniref:DNA ligase D n=1 Tax=Aromatoleum sp. TaxID=2307007 RepID=UPI00289499A7|nr:DNA ligase D [Aromatoleum sp.]MDT3669180.1 DNA ligase D [Aromatoleum sp.]
MKQAGRDKAAESALARYREMRDFKATPEPSGADMSRGAGEELSFTVQRHAARRLHYDFRLEFDGVLRSWAVPKGPSLDPSERRLAVETEDHPLDYGDFEGVIPAKQYGAGEVVLWDRGSWSSISTNPAAALAKGKLKFRLDGDKLKGAWTLVRMRGRADEDERGGPPNWLLIKEDDDEARAGEEAEITLMRPGSVKRVAERAVADVRSDGDAQAKRKTGTREGAGGARRKASDAAKGDDEGRRPLPAFVAPQLASLVADVPPGSGWLYEIKYDGYRLMAKLQAGKATLFTRNGHDWTAKLPQLAKALAALELDDSWLDGEIIVNGDDGLPDFQALQNAFDVGATAQIVYYIFDAPWLGGRELTGLPLVERKRLLADALAHRKGGAIGFSEHFADGAGEALDQACRLGMEGLIGKRADARYVSGRGRSWIKLKCRPRQEFVIGGYTEPGGSRKGFGALLVGLYDDAGELNYAGKVGTGFEQSTLARLASRLAALERDDCPFARKPRATGQHWVRPTLVAEIEYAGWTREGLLRQAAFAGLREDKPARLVQGETVVPVEEGASGEAVEAFAADSEMTTDPAPPTRNRTDSARKKAAPVAAVMGETAGAEPAKAERVKAEAVETEPPRAGTAKAEARKGKATKRKTTEPDTTKPEVAKSVSAKGDARRRVATDAKELEVADVRTDVKPNKPATPAAVRAGAKKESVRVAGVVISSPERIVWPDAGLTKADLARYYEAVGRWLLPHIVNRPLSLLRCPDGSAAECFFQRHMGQERPVDVESFIWEGSSPSRRSYLYVTSLEGVIGMVQRGAVEFHTWGSTMPRADRPDRITIDLDPAPDVEWKRVVEAARLVHGLFDELGLPSFLKTTGGKGLHVVVPLQRGPEWEDVKRFSKAFAARLASVLPERFTSNMAKNRRTGRVFVDYLRNGASATAICAYAARARPGAPVSMPLAWDELGAELKPGDFTIVTVPERLESRHEDSWRDYAKRRNRLTRKMWEALGEPPP